MLNFVYLLRLLIFIHIHLFIKFLTIKLIGRYTTGTSSVPTRQLVKECSIILAAFVVTSYTSSRSMNIFEKGVEVSGLLIISYIESKMLESLRQKKKACKTQDDVKRLEKINRRKKINFLLTGISFSGFLFVGFNII